MSGNKRFSTLAQWLAWQESLHLSSIDLGLDRVGRVAHSMGLIESLPSADLKFSQPRNPQVITIAGTNGKGSCVATLEHLLLKLGYTVGAYTSPHFLHYCERIRVNGKPAAESAVCDAFAAIDTARGDTSLTYFEFGTLAGLEVFRQAQVDFVLLEVGLGGRLDAVNVVDAHVAVVTSIALDHEDWLGNDLAIIAREKSGIARMNRPLISTVENVPEAVEQAAVCIGANLQQIKRDFQVQCANGVDVWSLHSKGCTYLDMPLPSLPLPSVVAALLALQCVNVSLESSVLAAELPKLALPGRFQPLPYKGRQLLLDVAHNPAAAEFLAKRLAQSTFTGRTFALIGIMADKDITAVLSPLLPQVEGWVAVDLEGNARAASSELIKQKLLECGASVVNRSSVEAGLGYMLEVSSAGDRLLVLGSFFTVAAALSLVSPESNSGKSGLVEIENSHG